MEGHYSSEEEEVYIGPVTESEIPRIRRFLGSNYNSPVTPRPPRFNQGGLPDVLGTVNTSTPVQRQLSAESRSGQPSQHHLPLDDSSDEVIILDASANSNSVITLSDDESFIRNEESCTNKSARDENVKGSMEKVSASDCEISNNSDTAEISEPHHESFNSGDDLFSNSVIAEDKSLHESVKNNSGNGISLNDNSASNIEISFTSGTASVIDPHNRNFSSDKDFVSNSVVDEDKCLHAATINDSVNRNNLIDFSSLNYCQSYIPHTTADKFCELKSNEEDISSSLIQDIDEFVGNSNVLDKSSATVDQITVGHSPIIPNNPQSIDLSSSDKIVICHNSSSGEKSPEISSVITPKFLLSKEPSKLQKCINIAEEGTEASAGKLDKHSLDMSGLNNFEFSLNGVTDSILDISHGSSLPSPPDTHQSAIQKPSLYEDISFNGEQLGNITDIYNLDDKTYQEDLHMSVDEVDFHQERFSDNFVDSSSLGNSVNISQPSEYKSCPSACSSYSTAYDKNCCEKPSTSEQSNSFQNYRDVSTDLDICTEMDTVSIKSNEENENEANFVLVMQTRQNSFKGTPASKMSEDNKEGEKSKVLSKLPVYQNSKSLLRPPKFYVKPDNLKTSSYKFAKQISKVGCEKNCSNLPKPEICKIAGPSTVNKHMNSPSMKEKKIPLEKEKTFTKISTPKQNIPPPKQFSSLTKSNIPSHSNLTVNKTPAQNIVNKTPAKSAVNRTLAQNLTGIPRAVKSDSKVRRALTPLRDYNMGGLSAGKTILTKNKYKNIISPIQSYIRGSPIVAQRKAKFEDQESPEGQQSKPQNPPSLMSPVKSAPRVAQMLNYENVQGQENVNPNVIEPSRDTLPCKILEPSLEVFWKEREQPQTRLPKMGEKHTKILLAGIPKIKVTIHEGRVNQSPKSKGILVPNNENSISTSTEILNVDGLSSEQSEGRISVRTQKTIELP